MTIAHQKAVGLALSVVGAAVVLCSPVIVFPVLERLLGIETIVGRRNVVYHPDGGYAFTNPGAMVLWIASVAAIGVVVGSVGVRMFLKARRASL